MDDLPDRTADDDLAGTVTWRELLAETIDRLTGPGDPGDPVDDDDAVADARTDAARIVAEAAGVTDAELFSVLGERATVGGVTRPPVSAGFVIANVPSRRHSTIG